MTITGSAENRERDEFRLEQQCYLMHVMAYSGQDESGTIGAGLAAGNRTCKYTSFIPIDGDPTTMMSVLTGRNDLGFLTNLTPFQMSFLVPKIKLYKTHHVTYPADHAGRTFDVEFIFPDNISGQVEHATYQNIGGATPRIERMLTSRAGRGMGVGLKEFSWTYEGTNPHEAANLLTARVSLHFNDINELFERRGPDTACFYNGYPKTAAYRVEGPDDSGPYFRYVDLIMRTSETVRQIQPASSTDSVNSARNCAELWLYDPTHFEIKALVGYAVKDSSPFTSAQIESIKSASIGLYLTIVDHVIDYNEDGSVGLNITYRAAVDGLLDDKNADLFLSMWEQIRIQAVEAAIGELQTANRRSPTSGGGTQTPMGSVTNPPSRTGTADPDIASGSYQQQITDLRNAVTELQSVSRAVTINSLSDWVADIGVAGSNGQAVSFGAGTAPGLRKLQKDTRPYGEYSPSPETTLYPLTYGCPHGAGASNTPPGLPRIKWVAVQPNPGDDDHIWSKTDGVPSYYVGGSTSQENTTAANTVAGITVPAGSEPAAGMAAVNNLNTETQDILDDLANPDESPNASAVTSQHQVLENMVKNTRTFDTDPGPGVANIDAFTIPYVFYGDILDWAIRKALKRVPFAPAGVNSIDAMQQALAESPDLATKTTADYLEELDPDGSEGVAGLTLTSGNPADAGGESFKTVDEFLSELRQVKKRMDKLTIVVGSMSYWDPVNKKYQQINLADIPVALDVLNNWIVNRLLRPGVTTYSLRDFIRDSLENLILDILSGYGCYEDEPKQMFDVGMVNFTMPGVWDSSQEKFINPATLLQNNDPPTTASDSNANLCVANAPGERSSLYKTGTYRVDLNKVQTALTSARALTSAADFEHQNTDLYDFVAIYCRTYEIGTLLGFETQEEANAMLAAQPAGSPYEGWGEIPGDSERGIYHLHLGQNQGLVKGITFSRTDQPYLAESRIFAHGHFGYNQLRGRYDATVRLQGNCLFLPGQLLYINPTTVGSGNIEYGDYTGKQAPLMLGLGGYYVVLDVQNTVTSNSFETTLRCIWHSSGLAEACQPNSAEGSASNLGGADADEGTVADEEVEDPPFTEGQDPTPG